jgi:hypothetical protein
MGRFKISWDIFKRSLSVIVRNKTLLSFPAIALVFVFIIALFFVSPFVLSNTGHALTDPLHWEALRGEFNSAVENKDMISGTIGFTWFAVIYLISMFSATFINVAFYNEIIHALNDNGVSIARGFKAALSKIKLIMIWSLFAGIVGIIIKNLEERLGFVGRWIIGLIGISWSVASIFIIPVIIKEGKSTNPLKLLKTSALTLKKTWGETVIGYIGIGSLFLFGLLGVLLLLISWVFVVTTFPQPGPLVLTILITYLVLVLLFLILLLPFGFLTHVAHHVYRCALYVYATEGAVPGSFDEEMMNRAWKIRKV